MSKDSYSAGQAIDAASTPASTAADQHTQATHHGESPACACAPGDLRVVIWPGDTAFYYGAAQHLEAEGLIPPGFEWPLRAEDRHWTAGGFEYCLRRTRPEGHKGPMRTWLALDSWVMLVKVTGRDMAWHVRRIHAQKVDELRRFEREHTPEGVQEWFRRDALHQAARRDRAFKAFKARVPGLTPPRRGRQAVKGGGL